MPERFEIHIVYKRRYINTLLLLFFFYVHEDNVSLEGRMHTIECGNVLFYRCVAQSVDIRSKLAKRCP